VNSKEPLAFLVCLAGFLFSGWNLYWGYKNGKIWFHPFGDISRQKTPWNFWVAVFAWTLATVGCAFGFVVGLIRFISE
jgi:hypothetical protein